MQRASVGEGERQNSDVFPYVSVSAVLNDSVPLSFVFRSIKKFNVQYTRSVCWFTDRSGDRLGGGRLIV